MKEFLYECLNDLFNDGINITTFLTIFKEIPSFTSIYEEKLNLLTDQSLKILPNSLKFSSYLNLTQKLSSIPEINELIANYKLQYIKYKAFIPLFGPNFCRTFDLNYKKVKNLFDYVLINKENDGIVVENIFKILEIPTNWVPDVSKILSQYDGIETIFDFFVKLNVLPEYFKFIEKVDYLKIPKNGNIRFFSINRIIDCQTSFIVLLDAVDQKIREIYFEIKKALPQYKPFNFQRFIEKVLRYINGIEKYRKMMGYPTPINVTNIFNEQVQLKIIVKNLTRLYKALKNDIYLFNYKLVFDYLNMEKAWINSRNIVYHVSQDDSLCDFFNIDTQNCNKIFVSIVEKSRFFVSKSSFAKSTPKYVTEFYIPLLKSLSLSISDFLSYAYSLLIMDIQHAINFKKFVSSLSKLFESTTNYIGRIDTNNMLINVSRSKFVCDLLKNDGSFELLIDPKISILIEMLKNGAKSYVDKSTTFETIVKSIRPNYFLDVYQTLLKFGELKNLKVSSLGDAIIYDKNESAKNINDIFPIKSIVINLDNCKSLSKEMSHNKLYIESISKCIGVKKEKLKEFLSKHAGQIISFIVGRMIHVNKIPYFSNHSNYKIDKQ